jgi:GDP-4-dehydro-6-deoxy-D-mannose reductase
MRTLLVTGASGFLGQHVQRAARAEGLEVVALDRVGPQPVDLLDLAAVTKLVNETKPDVVLHLASLTSQADLRALFEVNVTGTAVLCEALRESPARLLVVGSSSVYGNAGEGLVTEASPAAPRSLYAVSKWSQEAVALRTARVTGRPVTIARLFNLIGPGMPPTLLAGAMAEQLARAEAGGTKVLRFGALTATRDFLDVRDAAGALLKLAVVAPQGPINVCTGVGLPVSRCLEALREACAASVEVVTDESRSRPDDIPVQIGDPGAVRRLTGWRATIPFEQSLRDLLEECRARVRLELT